MRFTTREEIIGLLGVAQESRTLEFKQEVHLQKLSDRKEFLRDVTSLANTDGGYLLIGVKERGKVANGILPVADHQTFQRDALNLLRYSVKPQIFGLRMWPVEVEPEKYVVVIYVPMSWNRPHMVVLKGERGFWGRNEEGKYPLDVATLRALFLWGQVVEERLAQFRAERVAWLLSRDTKRPYVLLHFVPFSSLQPGRFITPDPKMANLFRDVGGAFQSNFEGGYVGALPPAEFAHYVQIFRSGAVEMGAELYWEARGHVSLNLGRVDHLIRKVWLPALWHYQKMFEVEPPFAWTLSLLNVKGLRPPIEGRRMPSNLRPGDRPHMLLPLQVLETWRTPEDWTFEK